MASYIIDIKDNNYFHILRTKPEYLTEWHRHSLYGRFLPFGAVDGRSSGTGINEITRLPFYEARADLIVILFHRTRTYITYSKHGHFTRST